jgi:hypothetical protein
MFSHRAPMLSSTHPSSSSTARQFVSNENAIVSSTKSSSVSTTTPAKSGTGMKRRAFGDISNKKQAPSSTKSSSNSSSILLKKTTAFTPRSKLQHYQQQSLIPIPKANSNSTRNPSSFAPKSTKNVSQQAIVPRKTSTLTTQIKETSVAKTVVFETVEDVELPAGRLFSQQSLDEDDLTDISEDEFNRTLWDDWRASVRQQYDEHGLKIDQEVEMQVQERMKSVFQQEDGKLELYEYVIFFFPDDVCKLIYMFHSILLYRRGKWNRLFVGLGR